MEEQTNKKQKRRGLVKTKTIKERAIYVYLPSIKMAREWKELAEKAGISISKFVVEHVENSLMQERGDKIFASRKDLIRRIKELEKENKEIQKKYDILSKAYEKLEDELKSYRRMPFYEEQEGIRRYEKEIVEIFKKKKRVRSDELLDELGISPNDKKSIKAINRQIQNLEAYGLIEPFLGGWKWKE